MLWTTTDDYKAVNHHPHAAVSYTHLKTKRPMSDDAIGLYNYHTGLMEDRAYNQTVYVIAIDLSLIHIYLH